MVALLGGWSPGDDDWPARVARRCALRAVRATARRSRRAGGDHPGRHEVRVRARSGDGELILIDEVLTPDSSRFWDAATYEPGRAAGELRQAVRARLARGARPGTRRAPGPGAAGRRRRRARAPATSRRSSASPAPASSATSRRTSSPDERRRSLPLRGQRHARSRASSTRRAGRSRAACGHLGVDGRVGGPRRAAGRADRRRGRRGRGAGDRRAPGRRAAREPAHRGLRDRDARGDSSAIGRRSPG